MERDQIVAFLFLLVLLSSVPVAILFVKIFSKNKGIQASNYLDSTKPTDLAPHVAKAFFEMEQMKKNPFRHTRELQIAFENYFDENLNEIFPKFSPEEIQKTQKFLSEYPKVIDNLIKLQNNLAISLKSSDQTSISKSIADYKEYSSSVRETGYQILCEADSRDNYPQVKRSICWAILKATYIPFMPDLISALADKSVSADTHRLLTKGEGAFLPEPGEEKVAQVNPDSTVFLLLESIISDKDRNDRNPSYLDSLFKNLKSDSLTYYLKYRDYFSLFMKDSIFNLEVKYHFPLISPGPKKYSKNIPLAQHIKMVLHTQIERINFKKPITMSDVLDSDALTENESEFLKLVSETILGVGVNTQYERASHLTELNSKLGKICDQISRMNYYWDGFTLGDNFKPHVDQESFNNNIVYGLLQILYQKKNKQDFPHFSRFLENGRYFFVPSPNIDPETLIILAACHHHQIINKIGLTLPLFPLPLANCLKIPPLQEEILNAKYDKIVGIPMNSSWGEVKGASLAEYPPELLKIDIG